MMSADTYLVPVPMTLFNEVLKEVPSPLVLKLQELPTMPTILGNHSTEKLESVDINPTMQLEINSPQDASVLHDFIRSIEKNYASGPKPQRIIVKVAVLPL